MTVGLEIVIFPTQASGLIVFVIVQIAESRIRREPTSAQPIRRRVRKHVSQPASRRPSLDEFFVTLEPGMVRDRIGTESVRRIVRLDRFGYRVELVVRDEARGSRRRRALGVLVAVATCAGMTRQSTQRRRAAAGVRIRTRRAVV